MNPKGFIPTLIFTQNFLPADGGSIYWLVNTYSRYDPREVVFVADQYDGDQEVDRTLPFRVERIPMNFSGWDPTEPAALCGYVRAFRQVRKFYRQYHIQQIHVARVMPEGFVVYCLHQFNGARYVLYAHGEEIKTGLTSRKFAWLMPRIYNGASAIIANSRNTKRILTEIGVHEDKIQIIHPGVDAAAFCVNKDEIQRVRQRHQLGDGSILLIVGRLQKRKGQDMLIKALPMIQKRYPQTKCLIVGTGEEELYLKQLTNEVGVNQSVIFVGRVDSQDLAAYYGVCDLFVMPNRQIGEDIEGFGMVFLEASATGKAVIGGNSGGTDDAILDGVTGLRVDGNKVEDIAEAVIGLLSDPERARSMGENGRRRVETEFSWDSIFQQTRSLASAINGGLATGM
ncbi:MAG: glycosyltransferase family 4 protein [Nitrospinae bacterium]|nr:glycosyltransferase family 4 protein [Nitrospinota bacterium]